MACTIFSDDEGKTWCVGNAVKSYHESCECKGLFKSDEQCITESQIIVTQNDDLKIFMRNHDTCRKIATAISKDGGYSFTDFEFNNDLTQPICQLSVIRDEYNGKPFVLFINPCDESERINGTAKLSFDDGKTFPYSLNLIDGTFIYNSSVYLGNGEVAMLYESSYGQIELVKFTLQDIINNG